MGELIERIIRKTLIIIHRKFNHRLYYKGVLLYGVPKLFFREKIVLEKNVRINEQVFIHGAGGILIEENVTLSYGVTLLSTGYCTENWETNKMRKEHENKSVIIRKNVWVCANATILPGIEIAEGIIVGAGSVVTKDLLETGCLYAGNPAKKIKKL